MYVTQGEHTGWRNGIYALWFIYFSKITLRRGYKIDKFALFDFCFAIPHPILRILVSWKNVLWLFHMQ